MTKEISQDYAQKMLDFTEEVRTLLGFGYGEGHDFSDMLRVLKARNAELNRYQALKVSLTPGTAYQLLGRVDLFAEDPGNPGRKK